MLATAGKRKYKVVPLPIEAFTIILDEDRQSDTGMQIHLEDPSSRL
jgi:hypothetical protein